MEISVYKIIQNKKFLVLSLYSSYHQEIENLLEEGEFYYSPDSKDKLSTYYYSKLTDRTTKLFVKVVEKIATDMDECDCTCCCCCRED